jgi:protein-S-isoprenylcysteine O-methyltransferase Ste14
MNQSIQVLLARSYLAYFFASILGLLADSIVVTNAVIPYATVIAVICFALGPLLILWAQYTSRRLRHHQSDSLPMYFKYGPYRVLRNPTHLGLVILVAGYTAISGSVIFLAVTVIGYIVSNFFFHQYELVLRATFGDAYETYKREVPKIF